MSESWIKEVDVLFHNHPCWWKRYECDSGRNDQRLGNAQSFIHVTFSQICRLPSSLFGLSCDAYLQIIATGSKREHTIILNQITDCFFDMDLMMMDFAYHIFNIIFKAALSIVLF